MTAYPYTPGLPDPSTHADFYAGIRTKRLIAWVLDMVLIAVLSSLLLPFTAFAALFFFPFFMLVIGFFYRWFTPDRRISHLGHGADGNPVARSRWL